MIEKRGNGLKKKDIELLAPAGSYEGLEAAIGAGADAVYVGGAAFGARAYAKNFQEEELLRAIDHTHIHGKKLYLTVNTLFKNRELTEQLYNYLLPYYEAGLDAVIVQDLGALAAIREMFPGLPLHASTQMTVTGPEGMRFLEEQGVSRVVPARELSLEEIRKMHEASPIEIETFIHGALCYSYSGQCLMSSMLGGRSGNRGRCAQPCRLPYETALKGQGFKGKKDLCPLSLKDISTIEILPEILDAGVTSLKIEGRMKQPAYTAGVTSMYRKYLDLLFEKGPENYRVKDSDRKYLIDIFNRGGSCKGYYQMANGPAMMAFTNEKKTGDVTVDLKERKQKAEGHLMLYAGSPAILEVSLGEVSAAASAGEVQFARSQPLDRERIRRQMEKLGNTAYQWGKLEIEGDENIFISMKELNQVRREAFAALEEEILRKTRRTGAHRKEFRKPEKNSMRKKSPEIYVSCENTATAEALLKEEGIKGMYLSFDSMKTCLEEGRYKGIEMYLTTPYVMRGELPDGFLSQARRWLEQGMSGFLVRSLEGFAALKNAGLAEKCVLDHTMYTWNNEAVKFWKEQNVLRNTLPLELNEGELRHRDNSGSEMLIYGYLPLMISAQCVRKNLYGCNGQEEWVTLRDRYGKEFRASCFCNPWKMENTRYQTPCYNIIYNSIPFGLLKEKQQVEELGISSVRLAFTAEEPEEAVKIFREFRKGYREGGNPPQRDYTKGHFKRGAE